MTGFHNNDIFREKVTNKREQHPPMTKSIIANQEVLETSGRHLSVQEIGESSKTDEKKTLTWPEKTKPTSDSTKSANMSQHRYVQEKLRVLLHIKSDINIDTTVRSIGSEGSRLCREKSFLGSLIRGKSGTEINDGGIIPINSSAIALSQRGQHVKAVKLYEKAWLLSLKTLPHTIHKRIAYRSSSHSSITKSESMNKKVRFDECNFASEFYKIHVEDSAESSLAVLFFNGAQSKLHLKDYRGALECYQRSFFVDPESTSRIFVSLINNVSQIACCLVGSSDVPSIIRKYFGKTARKYFVSLMLSSKIGLPTVPQATCRYPQTNKMTATRRSEET